MTNDKASKAALAAKVAKVQQAAEVSALPKRHVTVTTSTGGSYTYDYIEEATLMEKIRPLLAEEGIAVFYSDEIKSVVGNLATVRVTLTLVDGETGDQTTMYAEGVGTDKGDKHVNKAKTAAMRYLLWKWFLVPSDVDPEVENIDRSAKPPRSQMKWATKEDVDAYVEEVVAAGFARGPIEERVDKEFIEWEGYRESWLAGEKEAFEVAKAKLPDEAQPEPTPEEAEEGQYAP